MLFRFASFDQLYVRFSNGVQYIPVVSSGDGQNGMNPFSLLIAGDFCPSGLYEPHFLSSSADDIFDNLVLRIRTSSYAIFNLECVLADPVSYPLEKTGSHLSAHPHCINVMAKAGFNACNLANNHIMDYGSQGLFETIKSCNEAGIRTFGAGLNLEEARKFFVVENNGIKVGVVTGAEHEWSIASVSTSGANPFSMPETLLDVQSLRPEVEFLLVLLHTGREHYPLPYPRLQEYCRFLVSAGADAVICQHSHCIGAIENYKHGLILYGQGNLIFRQPKKHNAYWNQGLLVEFDITGRGNWKHTLIPYLQSQDFPGTRLMNAQEQSNLFHRLNDLGKVLDSPDALEAKWKEDCSRYEQLYLGILAGCNPNLLRVLKRVPFFSNWYSYRKRQYLLNAIRCQTHNEICKTIASF